MTVYTDTVITEPQIWWETAGKDSLEQVFTFTPMENEDDKNYFVMKNVKTGKYVGEGYNEEGEMANFVALTEVEDTIEIRALGAGQVGLYDGNGMFHTGSHNGGAASTTGGAYGGVAGVYSQIVHWTAEAGSGSAWYICEMSELPLTALTNTTYYLYEEVAVVAFVADKATEFEDFAVYGVDGQLIEAELEQMGNTMLVTLPEAVWAFSYSFNNKEGVNVTVNKSKIGELRAAYDEAAALAPEEGEDVGQYSDLSAYNKAMADAEELLSKGATDAEVDAAVKAIEEAVAALVPNMPVAGKAYYIISAYEVFEQNHDVPMAIYAKETVADGVATNTAKWFYISSKPTYHWEFEVAETKPANPEDEAAKDTVLYNIKNVGTGLYVAPIATSANVQLTAKVSEAGLYSVDITKGTSASISLNGKHGGGDYVSIHCGGHGSGSGKAGNIVGWGASAEVSQWKICEVESVLTDLDFTVVEDNDEQVAPAVKGIYDLYGRRVIAPTAPGIYIIDGKKRVIK